MKKQMYNVANYTIDKFGGRHYKDEAGSDNYEEVKAQYNDIIEELRSSYDEGNDSNKGVAIYSCIVDEDDDSYFEDLGAIESFDYYTASIKLSSYEAESMISDIIHDVASENDVPGDYYGDYYGDDIRRIIIELQSNHSYKKHNELIDNARSIMQSYAESYNEELYDSMQEDLEDKVRRIAEICSMSKVCQKAGLSYDKYKNYRLGRTTLSFEELQKIIDVVTGYIE